MKSLSKLTLLAALLCGGANAAWADDIVVPTPVYFDDFSFTTSSTDADKTEIVGNGVFEDDADARFGRVFHNDPGATPTKALRTNYLRLPNNVLSHSTETKEMTIGFWVNVKNAADYFFSPIFSAYSVSPAANAEAGHAGNDDNWPMFVLQSRGLMQLNNGGWDNFDDADNVAGTNTASTVWLDDKAWHYYTMNLEKTEVLDFNDKSVAFAFGLDCRKEEKTKEAEELFDLYFAYVSRAHERIDQVLDISHFHICTPDDFMSELIDYYKVLGLQKLYCLNKDRLVNYTIQGIFTDDIFEYFYIGVYAKNATEEYYQKINKLLLENDCKLQYYYTDTILDIDNYSTPITYFMDSMFLELNPAAHMKKIYII